MIPVATLYGMLCYVCGILQPQAFTKAAAEPAKNAAELCTIMLIRAVDLLKKQGLPGSYLSTRQAMTSPRGQIDLTASLPLQARQTRQLVCCWDQFSCDSYANQVIKTTLCQLLAAELPERYRPALRRQLGFFSAVTSLRGKIDWAAARMGAAGPQRVAVCLCQLLDQELLQTREPGGLTLLDWFDAKRMPRLFEKFVLAYYRREYPQLEVRAARIDWQLDSDSPDTDLLPAMQTDVLLRQADRTLIIDTKYYDGLPTGFASSNMHADHLYQMFAYVKNCAASLSGAGQVSGLLLYAHNPDRPVAARTYRMSGSCISTRSLDLGGSFEQLAAQLDQIAADYFQLPPPRPEKQMSR